VRPPANLQDLQLCHPPAARTREIGDDGIVVERIQNLCRDDVGALDMIDAATKHEVGAPIGNQNAAKGEKTTVDNVNDCLSSDRPTGNTEAYALRKLRKDAPEIRYQRRMPWGPWNGTDIRGTQLSPGRRKSLYGPLFRYYRH